MEAITYTEVRNWSELMGINPTPDEATAIVQLSRMWISEHIRGRRKGEFPPWLPE